MSIGTVVQVSPGRLNPARLYIRLRGKAVYRYPLELTREDQKTLVLRIKAAGSRVQLKHWEKVR